MSLRGRVTKLWKAVESFVINPKQGLIILTLVVLILLGVVTIITPMMLIGNKTVGDVPSEPHVGFRSSPSTRGTMNVVWTCLATVFSCVYVSLHYDIPLYSFFHDAKSKWYKRCYKYLMWFMSERGHILIIGFFSPGLFLAQAFDEYWYSWVGLRFMRKLGFDSWKTSQCFFAEMGGFLAGDIESKHEDSLDFYEWIQKKKENGFLINIHNSLGHIKERSGSNALLKVIASIQIGWVLVQTIIRHIQFLPVSLLELITCAYIVCAVPTLSLWLDKPYDIREYYMIDPPIKKFAESTSTSTSCDVEERKSERNKPGNTSYKVEKEKRSCK